MEYAEHLVDVRVVNWSSCVTDQCCNVRYLLHEHMTVKGQERRRGDSRTKDIELTTSIECISALELY
jgi:hypothetical protein